jgi:hypothetical protein
LSILQFGGADARNATFEPIGACISRAPGQLTPFCSAGMQDEAITRLPVAIVALSGAMDRTVLLNVLREYDAALRANGATGLYVFGSRARGTERPDSDLDLFIDYDPAARIPNMFASCKSRRRFYAASGFLSPSRPATRFIRS